MKDVEEYILIRIESNKQFYRNYDTNVRREDVLDTVKNHFLAKKFDCSDVGKEELNEVVRKLKANGVEHTLHQLKVELTQVI